MLNTLIIALALMSSPKADIAASNAIVVPFETLDSYDKALKLKMGDSAWKYSIRELHLLFTRRPEPIELYVDPVHGSNNGVDWA